ncbi:MAG: M28 family peptidase [Planctomycetes bacterium]|nr:M28 family peptidase [Planctomycetota bacterium]
MAAKGPGTSEDGIQTRIESTLNEVPTAASLRAYHELLGSEPHVAGTPGDERTIQRIADAFAAMGLVVRRHEFHAYLAQHVDATVQITSPPVATLPLIERALPEDPDTSHPDLPAGFNAYSGSGDVTAEIVYANYGTTEDFEQLSALGVSVQGRIVMARYGKNYRGFKARYAEEAGAAGLIIFTDPADAGYGRGIPYPEGGYANASSIQRGSIKTLDYAGDPLTPFEPATANAARLAADEVALPRIPVQPLGWDAAAQIMSRMRGPAVPQGWQGGLPFAYRLTGGEDLTVRLAVRQRRALVKSANVLGVLPGTSEPEKMVIIGCHHDAWGFGASDPLAGTMILLECARSFAELARQGLAPARTIIFAAWGAEEQGIIGSVEWCEANRDDLVANAVAYINLDMAAMGEDFGASADPSLKRLITAATKAVPQARGKEGQSVFDAWVSRTVHDAAAAGNPPTPPEPPEPVFGNLGGGSDHVGFYCHLGIPSCGLGASGSPGTAYHSNYDTLAWYRKVVGDDYQPALMLTRLANIILARLANEPLLPLDPARYGPDLRSHLQTLEKRARSLDVAVDFQRLRDALDDFDAVAIPTQQRLLEVASSGRSNPPQWLRRVNALLGDAQRRWRHEPGLPGRPWFKNLFAATDPTSGYAAWMLPALRYHLERRDLDGVANAVELYAEVLASLKGDLSRIGQLLGLQSLETPAAIGSYP